MPVSHFSRLTACPDNPHVHLIDLLAALRMEIQFRRKLKAQTIEVMERICTQRVEDAKTVKAEAVKLSAASAQITDELTRSTKRQEKNVLAVTTALDVYALIFCYSFSSELFVLECTGMTG
jgi:hypothetical protein